jgi:hypothetical protein
VANAYAPTYSELVEEIQDICEDTNDEFVENIPRFIHRAQDQVQRDLGLALWRDYQDDVPITAAEYARNTDWLIVLSIYLPVQNKFLERRSLDYVRVYGGGTTGRPRFWAEDMENTLLIGPTPDASYSALVEFYKRLPALSGDNETNWITSNAGDLLLLQSLINAGSYLLSHERVNEYTGMYSVLMPQCQNELRDSERVRDQPTRVAGRLAFKAGESA